jgi:hypothetical protein
MLEQTLTIKLPESLLQRVQRVAELTYRSVDEVLVSALDATLRVPPGLPTALADELAALALFTDEALLAATKSSLSLAQQHRLRQLTEASKTRTLTSAESAELDHLVERYDIAVLRRAQALALLAQRGYSLPERNDFSDDLPSATGDTPEDAQPVG